MHWLRGCSIDRTDTLLPDFILLKKADGSFTRVSRQNKRRSVLVAGKHQVFISRVKGYRLGRLIQC